MCDTPVVIGRPVKYCFTINNIIMKQESDFIYKTITLKVTDVIFFI